MADDSKCLRCGAPLTPDPRHGMCRDCWRTRLVNSFVKLGTALGGLRVPLLFTISCDVAGSPPRPPPRQVRTAQLLQMDFAKQTRALEHNQTTEDTPVESDLFGADAYIRQKASCPAGGVYRLGRVGRKPTGLIPGHTL